jgi:hypothetical protein
MQVDSSNAAQPFQLLQLPAPELNYVLKKLDKRSLTNSALSCSKLRTAVPASITEAVVHCNTQEKVDSFKLWLQQNDSSVQQCWIEDMGRPMWQPNPKILVDCLPCPQLRLLSLKNLKVQLEPAGDSSGILRDCTGLTALALQACTVKDPQAAFAAIAALPELRSLCLVRHDDARDGYIFGELQPLTKLTQLWLDVHRLEPEQRPKLAQLSALTNLEELWIKLPPGGVPGGFPSQLQQLRTLDVLYGMVSGFDAEQQFQHLGSLTALQGLTVTGFMEPSLDQLSAVMTGAFTGVTASSLAGIQHLSQLTSLEISGCPTYSFTADGTSSWAPRLTALEKLKLSHCSVQAEALAAFTQLRSLSVCEIKRTAPLDDLLHVVSGLPHLTELTIRVEQPAVPAPSPAACTALKVSTNLCSLKLGIGKFPGIVVPSGFDLFTHGTVYPSLRKVNLSYDAGRDMPDSFTGTVPVTEQQLQQLCSCCPAVEQLAFTLSKDSPPTAHLPLLQLSALTYLTINNVRAAAPAAVDVAAQLTGLRMLAITGLPQLTEPALLQLTALKALEAIKLVQVDEGFSFFEKKIVLHSKVRTIKCIQCVRQM